MKTVLFANNQGEGIILNYSEELKLRPDPVTLAGSIITPGNLTTLNDFFCRPLMYCGLMNDKTMIFFIGEHEDKYYYQVIHKITETRFYINYKPGAGRDYNFKGGRWK